MPDSADEIQSLIREEPDARTRALRLILARIDNSLQENTRQTREIWMKLDAHLTRYEEQARADASHRAQALERHAARPARAALRPVGACYYCGEAVPAGRLFCDAECGWAWEDQRRTLEAQWLGRIGR